MFINISCLRISQNVKDVTVKDVKGMTFGPLILRKDENISRKICVSVPLKKNDKLLNLMFLIFRSFSSFQSSRQ